MPADARLVGGEPRRDLRQAAVAERLDDADIGVGRALLEALRKTQHVGLVLERGGVQRLRHFGVALGRHGRAAELADGGDQRIAVLLVVRLEQHGHFEHRLLQQAALGAELVGADRLVLERQCRVEDADVVGRTRAVARLRRGHLLAAGEKSHGRGRQNGDAGPAKQSAAAKIDHLSHASSPWVERRSGSLRSCVTYAQCSPDGSITPRHGSVRGSRAPTANGS
jgi:hypothetical protein